MESLLLLFCFFGLEAVARCHNLDALMKKAEDGKTGELLCPADRCGTHGCGDYECYPGNDFEGIRSVYYDPDF
jgi:hypothetical protein